MKKIYQTPAMEVYATNLEASLLENSPRLMDRAAKITSDSESSVMESNTRRTVHEDGLRDWNIDLW